MELLSLSVILVIIELVFPEWANVTVYLMVTFVVDTFETIQTRFSFQSFELKNISPEVSFITSCYISVVFEFV